MFKPLQMRRIRILVLDSYLDRVMNVLGKLRSVQITEVKEGEKEISREKILERYSSLLNSIYYLIDVLKIRDEEIERVSVPEKSSGEYLNEMEKNINSIVEEAESISERLEKISGERKILKSNEFALNCLSSLGIDAGWLGTSDFLYVTAGFLDPGDVEELKLRVRETTKEDHIILMESFKDRILAIVVTLKGHQNDVEGVLKGLRFDALELTNKNLREIKERLESIKEIEDRLHKDLDRIRDEHSKDILVAKEMAQIEKNTQEMVLNLGKTDRVYTINGWIPAREVDNLVREVREASDGCAVIRIYEPEPDETVPVLLDNPKPFKPFESITEMFGLPSYNEIDPTPIIAITFPLIFGLMFGDVGHGAVLALAGLGMIFMKKGNESYWNFGMILLYCGIFAIIFGFLYGSIFGNEEILSNLYEDLGVGHTYTTPHGEFRTLWMSPTHNMMELFGIALFVGVLHMGLGLIASAVNKVQESGLSSIVPSLSKLWFFCGEVTIIALIFRFPIPLFIQVAEMYPLSDIVLYGICIPVALMLISELIHELHPFGVKKLLGAVGTGLFDVFETSSMFLSNTISYSRIGILAVIHAMMMMAIYKICSMEMISDIFILSIMIVVGGNILVLVLEGLIVFIHTIRLHFYEWFTKFYGAGGIKYSPFIIERRYTELTD